MPASALAPGGAQGTGFTRSSGRGIGHLGLECRLDPLPLGWHYRVTPKLPLGHPRVGRVLGRVKSGFFRGPSGALEDHQDRFDGVLPTDRITLDRDVKRAADPYGQTRFLSEFPNESPRQIFPSIYPPSGQVPVSWENWIVVSPFEQQESAIPEDRTLDSRPNPMWRRS